MIRTERLVLRGWRADDAEAHHAMCSHPLVTAQLGGPPSSTESRDVVERQNRLLADTGSCFWAMELHATGAFIGWCGVKPGAANTPIAGEPEIGWSVAVPYWRRGLALEAATACLAWSWSGRGHDRIAAITAATNARSIGLMRRLGMTAHPDETFDHPDLAADDPLRPHVTFRIARPAA